MYMCMTCLLLTPPASFIQTAHDASLAKQADAGGRTALHFAAVRGMRAQPSKLLVQLTEEVRASPRRRLGAMHTPRRRLGAMLCSSASAHPPLTRCDEAQSDPPRADPK